MKKVGLQHTPWSAFIWHIMVGVLEKQVGFYESFKEKSLEET